MKIIQVMPEFGLAGAETMCENLTRELMKLGNQVIVVSLYTYHSAITDRLEQAGADVRYLGKKPGLDLSMISKLRKIFEIEKPDVVHTHRYVMRYAIPAARMAGVPRCVHTVHSIAQKENTKLGVRINRFFYRRGYSTPVALSTIVQRTVQEVYKLPEQKAPVVFNGIDLSRCREKKSYVMEGRPFSILHIGRFTDLKNQDLILKTVEKLKKKGIDFRLKLIGDGENLEAMKDLAKELGLEQEVSFLGLQADVYPFLEQADLFILPSKYEGMPMTLLEAMGTGLPIVASAVGGIPDMLENGESALLIEPTEQALEEAIIQLYSSETLRQKLGQGAILRSADFSAEAMAQNYVRLYQKNADTPDREG